MDCPNDAVLAAFVSGQLPPAEEAQLLANAPLDAVGTLEEADRRMQPDLFPPQFRAKAKLSLARARQAARRDDAALPAEAARDLFKQAGSVTGVASAEAFLAGVAEPKVGRR